MHPAPRIGGDALGGPILSTYLNIIQIIVASALIALAVMQSQNAGLGRMFGGDSSVYRTRRGVEKTMHHVTIIMAVVFFITSLLNVLIQS
jgi:preprotein translocase subunit SecG